MSARQRVVITGAGIVSCIGNDEASVVASLHEGRSGISAMPLFAEMGLRSQVAGQPRIDLDARIDRKLRRFMGDAAAYAYVSLQDAIAQAGLTPAQISHPRTGLIMGSGGGSPTHQIEAADILRSKGRPYSPPPRMLATTYTPWRPVWSVRSSHARPTVPE